MTTAAWRANPDRFAWVVILVAFSIFVLSFVTVGLTGQWWYLNATVYQEITNFPNGTVLVTRPDRTISEANVTAIPVGATLETKEASQATLIFVARRDNQALASLQIFGNTLLVVPTAHSPRFAASTLPHRIELHLNRGRLWVNLSVDLARPVELSIITDSGALVVLTEPGSKASIETTNQITMVTVRDGKAQVRGANQTITLARDERAEVPAHAAPAGPLPAEQNLIKNSDFGVPLTGTWQAETWTPVDSTEPVGSVEPVIVNGRQAVWFNRRGNNWGQVGLTQELDRDVQGFKSLRLHLDVRLDFQDLSNCGLQGTECPVMVKINYVDIYGNPVEWLQGFYYRADANPNAGLTFCAPCAPVRFVHQQWPQSVWQTFDSENLLDVFARTQTPAGTLKSIIVYASGHSFTSLITDLQLLASE